MARKKLKPGELQDVLWGVTVKLLADMNRGRVHVSDHIPRPLPVRTINEGFCDQWAVRAKGAVGGGYIWITEEWSARGTFNWDTRAPEGWGEDMHSRDHVCLRIRGRYYDAEDTAGVDDVEDLTFIVERSR